MVYYIRSLLPVYLILFGISLVGRCIAFFERDSWVYDTVYGSAVVVFFISVFVTVSCAVAFSVIRYYKNMFTGEGYLTLTLPVSHEKHIFSKMLAAVAASVSSFLAVILAFLLFLPGGWMVEVFRAISYLVRELYQVAGFHLILYALELVLFLITNLGLQILVYYFCISLGQTFKKNRVLAAVGIYYGFYMILQFLSTFLSIVLNNIMENLPMDAILLWIEGNILQLIHGAILAATGANLLFALLFFAVCRYVLKRRLNLE